MGYEKIIALDLGKFKTVACLMDPESRQTATPNQMHGVECDAANAAQALSG